MAIEFKLEEMPAGISINFALKGDPVKILTTELIGPLDSNLLVTRLEQIQSLVFDYIPGFPAPSQIDNLLVVINSDGFCYAYVNELQVQAQMKIKQKVEKGEPILQKDIVDILSVDLGVDIPNSSGVIVVRSYRWKKSLYYDLAPVNGEKKTREFSLGQVFAQQTLLLLGISLGAYEPDENNQDDVFEKMKIGYEKMNEYLSAEFTEESKYQELLQEHPWMFGGQYESIDRHTSLDNENVPDFTAIRCHDKYRDIIEIKQPFLKCFKAKDKFSSNFNDSWNQAERYLSFVLRHRDYLSDGKELNFENPKCILVIGYDLSKKQLKMIREKENISKSIQLYTYNHIQRNACHIMNLVTDARPIKS